MTTTKQPSAYEGWAIVELMGHVRLGGWIRETQCYGAAMLRIDIPKPGYNSDPILDEPDAWSATQLIAPAALYRITPCGRDEALAVASANQPSPVHSWEMPRLVDATRQSRHDNEYRPHYADEHDDDDQEELQW